MKFTKKENNRIEIPEHLMKAPADSFGAPSSTRRSTRSQSVKRGKGKGKTSLKEQKERETESKKRANAERNLNSWFKEIKTCNERDDEADFNDKLKIKVKLCKEKDQQNRLLHYLC